MGAFRFKLDPVLRQRRREEQARQRDVAVLERERIALEEEIRACSDALRTEQGVLRQGLADGGRLDVDSIRWQAHAAAGQIQRAERAAVSLAGVRNRLQEARARLVEASTRRKAIEALRDRRLAAWVSERERKEAVVLDEIGTAGASRRAVSEGER